MVYLTLGEGFVHQNLRNFTFKSVNFGALNGSSLNFLQANQLRQSTEGTRHTTTTNQQLNCLHKSK